MLTLLMIAAVDMQAEPVAKFESYLKGAKTLSVDLEYTFTGYPGKGVGTFHYKRPNYILFTMKVGPSDYSFSIGPTSSVSIERGSKRYREYGDVGRLFMPELDISDTPQHSFPLALMTGSLEALVPRGVKSNAAGKSTVGEVPVDVVEASYDTQTGRVVVRSKVDSMGRALEFEKEMQGGGRSVAATIRVRNYRINIPIDDAVFDVPLPLGFVPQTLPADSYPLNVGEAFPLAGWRGTDGGDLQRLASGKATFIAIGEPNCDVSRSASDTVAALAKDIRSKGGVAVALRLSPGAGQAPVFKGLPQFDDPSARLANSLRLPGTPSFYLLSPKGEVTRYWYGFDPREADAFRKDVLEWLSGKPG